LDLGVFGGTFNPVHLGHLRVAEEVREALGIGRVAFVPAKIPPHKEASGIAAAETRLAFVREAVAGNPHFEVSDLELTREGPSYSVDTLHAMRQDLAPEFHLWFLMGSDAFREIHTWHRYPELFALADIAVMRRPPDREMVAPPEHLLDQFAPTELGFRHVSGHEVRFVPVTLLDISSTRIRRAIAERRSVRYLVPEAVLDRLTALGHMHPQWGAGSKE
jgi:nicotinate-nucleotide adenylyltransferase